MRVACLATNLQTFQDQLCMEIRKKNCKMILLEAYMFEHMTCLCLSPGIKSIYKLSTFTSYYYCIKKITIGKFSKYSSTWIVINDIHTDQILSHWQDNDILTYAQFSAS